MNEQSKKLLFNKSTLLSLKAELLKKQEEVKGKKQLPQHRVENYKPSPAPRAAPTVEKQETFRQKLDKEVDTDTLEAEKRSKSALERKAELYQHLTDGAGTSELSSRFLVDFRAKADEEKREERREWEIREKEKKDKEENEIEQDFDEDDDDWATFVDCLGRTRRCLKTDLEFYRKRDEEISKVVRTNEEGSKSTVPIDDEKGTEDVIGPTPPKPLLAQKTDAYLQSLREKWEEKEREMLARDSDIHYQDLLFDEARAHGVGYYSFSTDDAKRRHEQAELLRARTETQRAQDKAAERRAERDRLVAQRVAAARARQRERAGLPPEEPTVNKDEFQLSSLLDFLTEQKKEAADKAKEEEDKAREEREKEREKLREQYVREWDVGKEGVERKNEFRELTQEEYEERERSKRIKEFAPPQNHSRLDCSDNVFDDKGRFIGSNIPPPLAPMMTKTWADVRPNVRENEYTDDSHGSKQGLYFSSKESRNDSYSNFVKVSESVPIVNELEEEEKEEPRRKVLRRNNPGAEIEPPPTYDYYGPEAKRSRPQKGPDMREAYEQGLKYLQDMESKRNAPKKMNLNL